MFEIDQPIIANYARANADNFARVSKFVILTIQNSLESVVNNDMPILDSYESGKPADGIDGVLYGWKAQAVADINRDKIEIFELSESAAFHAESDDDIARAILDIFASRVGFGVTKAGFIAQLIYGVGGCLDSHNLARFGINPNLVRASRFKNAKTLKTRQTVITQYIDLCRKFGGCESLWDSWCTHVANKSRDKTPDYVSRLHLRALNLTR